MEEEKEQQQSCNYYRLVTLLIDIGGEVLRDELLKEIPLNTFGNVLQSNINLLTSLRNRKVLTEPQFALLLETPPDPNKFDISLLVALLRNLCPHIKPVPDWNVGVPDSADHSIGAELLRIKNIRNTKMHIPTTVMPKSTFQLRWTELAAIIHSIAFQVSQECCFKISKKILILENANVDPSGEKEQQLLNTLKDWQAQIIDILNEKVNSIQNSLESLHLKSDRGLDVVDALREAGDANSARLESINDSMSQIARDVSIISQDVSSMSNQAQFQGGGDSIPAQRSDIAELKDHLLYLRQELASMKRQIHHLTEGNHPITYTGQQNIPSSSIQTGENVGDLSDRDIDFIACKLGFDWERIATFLDYESNQIDDLKYIYRDQPVTRNSRMIKRWADVVVSCGESPRTLLAAAFASIQNNEMAQSLVTAEQVEVIQDQEASLETKAKIKQIKFDVKASSSSSRRSPVIAIGGEGGINVFDGEVNLPSLSIHSSVSSSVRNIPVPDPSSFPIGSNIQIGGPGSLNIHGGIVKVDKNQHINIGQPSLVYSRSSNVCRGEGAGEGVDMTDSVAAKTFESNMKKTIDNTMSHTVMGQYNDIMKSVGALVGYDQLIGTVFRVGSKYVMTAWHCIRAIIDPLGNGVEQWEILQNPKILITFNYPSFIQNQTLFGIQNIAYLNKELDIIVLELTEPSKLPPMLKLYKDEIPYMQVQYVDIIGYGHPQSNQKHFDQQCKTILQSDRALQEAQAWLLQNKDRLKRGLQSGVHPDTLDWGFHGYDRPEKMIYNCYLEKGSSGGPVLTTKCLKGPVVVGVVTNGLPHCFWQLRSTAQLAFPENYRFEMGSRMTHIYQAIVASNRDLARDLFC